MHMKIFFYFIFTNALNMLYILKDCEYSLSPGILLSTSILYHIHIHTYIYYTYIHIFNITTKKIQKTKTKARSGTMAVNQDVDS